MQILVTDPNMDFFFWQALSQFSEGGTSNIRWRVPLSPHPDLSDHRQQLCIFSSWLSQPHYRAPSSPHPGTSHQRTPLPLCALHHCVAPLPQLPHLLLRNEKKWCDFVGWPTCFALFKSFIFNCLYAFSCGQCIPSVYVTCLDAFIQVV